MSNPGVISCEADFHPHVWLLMGQKAGDNQQVLALAESLDWPFDIKRLAYRPYELWSNLLLGPNLVGVDKRVSSSLIGPWPDLVISSGRRNEPVARWIRAQAKTKAVKLVHVGRPWSPLRCFDLIISTPQYHLPAGENILENPLPMHRVSDERLRNAAAEWQNTLAHLPRPLTALLIGGNSGPYQFDHRAAERLINLTHEQVARDGGSLLVTTSARTPARVVTLLSHSFTCPHVFIPWQRGASQNPYLAFLALADSIIVTGDSMSMLAEATFTGKPVYIFGFGRGRFAMHPDDISHQSFYLQDYFFGGPGRWKTFTSKLALRLGPKRLTRDIRRIHQNLIADGQAAWLGAERPSATRAKQVDSISRSRARVKALFEHTTAN